MRLLADESVDGPVVVRLRADGHTVAWVAEDALARRTTRFWPAPTGKESSCSRRIRILASWFTDSGVRIAGVLLLRLAGLDEAAKCELVSRAVGEHGVDLAGAFSVLDGNALRIRKDPSA